MISAEVNDRMTRVGPGTPAGNLLRRYWMPVAGSSELPGAGTKKVRLLSEDLVLFKDQSGQLGLIAERCPHRGCSLLLGIPETDSLRCPYHGWLFDKDGACLEQPPEPRDSRFKDRIVTTTYQVREMGGLVWAYLGPDPAPVLPPFDLFVQPNVVRTIGRTLLPCNWLQIMENALDPVHFEYLHGLFGDYMFALRGEQPLVNAVKHHLKIGFDEFEFGIIKRRVVEGTTEEDEAWRVGHPMVFPNILRVGQGPWSQFQIRVPVDDEHTQILWYSVIEGVDPDEPEQASVPVYPVPYLDEEGNFLAHTLEGQDMMVWVSQGPIADRTIENVTTSDKGVLMMRRVLLREIEAVEQGRDPMGLIRDEAKYRRIDLPQERHMFFKNADSAELHILRQPGIRHSPIVSRIVDVYVREEARLNEMQGVPEGNPV